MDKFGESIYGTRGNIIPPQDWGVVTSKENKIFVHILKDSIQPIVITGIKNKIKNCRLMSTGEQVKYDQNKNEVTIRLDGIALVEPDTIIEIETK